MSQPFRTVARGLRWVFAGAWLTPGVIVAAVCLLCCAAGVPGLSSLGAFLAVGLTLLGLVGVATFVSPVGRLMCLATPEDAPVARTRIRLAVVFEACSVLNGIATIVIGIADLIPDEFEMIGVGFTLVTGVIARLFFLLYARSLAEHIGATDEAVTAKTIFHAALGLILSGVLSAGGFTIADTVPVAKDPGPLRVVVFTLAAGLMCLAVMCLTYLGVGYYLLFSTLWPKVRAFADMVPYEDDEQEAVGDQQPTVER